MRKSRAFPKTISMFPVSLLVVLLMIAVAAIGCGKQGHELASVNGKVVYRGKPLPFGTVTFQPENGRPSIGILQPDGTFQMATRGQGDGAAVGKNKVRICCFEFHQARSNERGGGSTTAAIGLGKALIPREYMSYETSGIVVEVRSGANDPVVLELKERAIAR